MKLGHDLGEGLAGLFCLAALACAPGGVLLDGADIGKGQALLTELVSDGAGCGLHLRSAADAGALACAPVLLH